AYVMHGTLAVAVSAAVVWLWRLPPFDDLKAAAFACACLLISPYVLDYDFAVLGVAIAFFVRHGLARGFHSYEISALALAWISPLLARVVASAISLPIGLIAMIVLFALTVRRAADDTAAEARADASSASA